MTRTNIKTVDALLTDGTHVLLIRRAKEPFQGQLAFPGGRLEEEEYELEDQSPGSGLSVAAVRELEEEVGLTVVPKMLGILIELEGTDRDPRPGHNYAAVFWLRVDRITLASARAASDAKSVHVLRLDELTEEDMAFDHWRAIVRMKEVLG